MGLDIGTIAGLVTALSTASTAGYTVKSGKKRSKESEASKKKTTLLEQEKKRKAEALERERRPGQRLLGGRPTLG